MSNGCTYKNPLLRNGVSQPERFSRSLDPEFVKVDERTLSDLLQFILDYSEGIQYYNIANEADDEWNWRLFVERDVATTIAIIAGKDASVEKECLEEIKIIVEDEDASRDRLLEALKALFELAFSVVYHSNTWYRRSVDGLRFNAFLGRVIGSRLKQPFNTLLGHYEWAKNTFSAWDTVDTSSVCASVLLSRENLASAALSNIWLPKEAGERTWEEWQDDIGAEKPFFIDGSSSTIAKKVRRAYSSVAGLVEEIVNTLGYVIKEAPGYVEDILKNYASHEPHMGLLLTFLQLFKEAQDHINTLTGRHLDYYYKEVLKIRYREAIPDTVHLVVELAKHVEEFQVKKDTLLKAGKDDKGNEVLYSVDRDRTVNRATVKELKSLFIAPDKGYRVYAAPVANSADGKGAPLADPASGWRPFGEDQPLVDPLTGGTTRTMTDAHIGFAVSSPILELSEGARTITLTLELENSLTESQKNKLDDVLLFRFYATGEKKWIELEEYFSAPPDISGDDGDLKFVLNLGLETPAIKKWQSDIHLGRYDTPYPVLRVELSHDRSEFAYGFLRNARINGFDIEVVVDGVRNLVLQNEAGVLDPSKPFAPFGSMPARGSQFYVGSREIFSKSLTSLTLNFVWHEWPNSQLSNYYNYSSINSDVGSFSNDAFKADLYFLKGGQWGSPVKEEQEIFPDNFALNVSHTIEVSGVFQNYSSNPQLPDFQDLDLTLTRGFVKIVLTEPADAFGHKLYPKLLTEAVTPPPTVPIPVEPYTPKISVLDLDYIAETYVDLKDNAGFEERVDRFYHLTPFGHYEVHSKFDPDSESLSVLPPFKHIVNGSESIHQGELYIGLEECKPPQTVSLLFKLAEGSADPKLDVATLSWFYLENNRWKQLKREQDYRDDTDGLLHTGIISLDLPREATSGDPVILSGKPLHWFKASISAPPGSVCKVVDLKAQAITARFRDRDNDPDFLANPLPAGRIGKLKEPLSEIKKIGQPYSSFGGKVSERDKHYYRRVSERLRHKDRSITMWDYERLVLEKFPDVYKAKCINHSTYDFTEPDGGKTTAEFAPGYVSVVVVANLMNKNAVNPLEPRVSLGNLNEILSYLKSKNSLFAAEKLRVINPLFEQIQAEFLVQFREVPDQGFYEKKLKRAVSEFLSPWAFGKPELFNFGGRVHKSIILNFVEKLDYVDYVKEFKLHHYIEGVKEAGDVDEIVGTTARSVLVSYPNHDIQAISGGM